MLIGVILVWFQGLEERKEEFTVLHRLGVRKGILVLTVQIEVLVLQMIIVLFVVNGTFVEVVNENTVLEQISFEKEMYFVEKDENHEEPFIEAVTNIMGQDSVGIMYRNGKVGIDEKDEIETPPLEYLNPTMEKIQYTLEEEI